MWRLSVTAPTVALMTTCPSRPSGQACSALAEVNSAIRQLMDQPAGDQRAEEYNRLLVLWSKMNQDGTGLTTAA